MAVASFPGGSEGHSRRGLRKAASQSPCYALSLAGSLGWKGGVDEAAALMRDRDGLTVGSGPSVSLPYMKSLGGGVFLFSVALSWRASTLLPNSNRVPSPSHPSRRGLIIAQTNAGRAPAVRSKQKQGPAVYRKAGLCACVS